MLQAKGGGESAIPKLLSGCVWLEHEKARAFRIKHCNTSIVRVRAGRNLCGRHRRRLTCRRVAREPLHAKRRIESLVENARISEPLGDEANDSGGNCRAFVRVSLHSLAKLGQRSG